MSGILFSIEVKSRISYLSGAGEESMAPKKKHGSPHLKGQSHEKVGEIRA
jgi:hypothetical protein